MLPLAQPPSQRRWRKQKLRGLGLTAGKGGLLGERIEGRVESLPGLFIAGGSKEGGGAVVSDVKEGKGSGQLLFFGGDGGKI